MSVLKGCSYQACHLLFEQNAKETKQDISIVNFFTLKKERFITEQG